MVTAAVINTADVLLLAREVREDTCPTLGATADFPEGRERWKQRGEPDRPRVHPGPATSRQWAWASPFSTLSFSLLICERGALCHFKNNKEPGGGSINAAASSADRLRVGCPSWPVRGREGLGLSSLRVTLRGWLGGGLGHHGLSCSAEESLSEGLPHLGFLLPGGPWVDANVPCTRPFEYVYFRSRR